MGINLTKDQLECLISDGTYGWGCVTARALASEKYLDEKLDKEYLEDRTYEEKLADRLLAGGHIFFDMGEEEDEGEFERLLTLEDFNKGMEKAAIIEPRHYADFMSENDDADTGYVLLQVIAYGEVVFG